MFSGSPALHFGWRLCSLVESRGRSPGLETGAQVKELCIVMRQVVSLRKEGESKLCKMMMARAVENSDFADPSTAARDREQLSHFGEDLGAAASGILRHHPAR